MNVVTTYDQTHNAIVSLNHCLLMYHKNVRSISDKKFRNQFGELNNMSGKLNVQKLFRTELNVTIGPFQTVCYVTRTTTWQSCASSRHRHLHTSSSRDPSDPHSGPSSHQASASSWTKRCDNTTHCRLLSF